MTILPCIQEMVDGELVMLDTVDRFSQVIPMEPGFYWVYPGIGKADFPFEIVKVEVYPYGSGELLFHFSHKPGYLDLSEVENEFLKEDRGLFGPQITPPKIK